MNKRNGPTESSKLPRMSTQLGKVPPLLPVVQGTQLQPLSDKTKPNVRPKSSIVVTPFKTDILRPTDEKENTTPQFVTVTKKAGHALTSWASISSPSDDDSASVTPPIFSPNGTPAKAREALLAEAPDDVVDHSLLALSGMFSADTSSLGSFSPRSHFSPRKSHNDQVHLLASPEETDIAGTTIPKPQSSAQLRDGMNQLEADQVEEKSSSPNGVGGDCGDSATDDVGFPHMTIEQLDAELGDMFLDDQLLDALLFRS